MVIGAIGRFVEQKGFHLARAIEGVLQNMKVQFMILALYENTITSECCQSIIGTCRVALVFDNARPPN